MKTHEELGLTDIEVFLHHETEKAWKVSTTGHRDDGVWVPKSQAELEQPTHLSVSNIWILTAPEPLLIEKGLV